MSRGMNLTVKLGDCTVTGLVQAATDKRPKSIEVFYNIPYANAKRFELPTEALLPETLDVTKKGRGCPAPGSPGDEDCLRVNITRPAGISESAGVPVLVYVHGGAFNFGNPLERDMANVVALSEQPILAVSIAYRLGVLGFSAFAGDETNLCNLGLRDQAAAFKWVARWIASFGGNPGKMTVVGASAGGHSIGHHLLSPSPLPFHKAILESGSPTARLVLSSSHPRSAEQHALLLKHASCSSLADLKALPLGDLLTAAGRVWSACESSVQWPFQPVIDGEGGMVPDLPLRLWDQRIADGRASNMRLIVGFCSHEGVSFVPESASSNQDFRAFFASLIPSLSPADLSELEALYPDPAADRSSPYVHEGREGAQFQRLAAAYGEFAYIAPVLHTAHQLSSAGAKVYVYEYAALSGMHVAAGHGSQGPAAGRETSLLGYFPGMLDISRELHGRMMRFVADDEGDLGDSWPVFVSPAGESGGDGKMLVFGEGNDELAGYLNKGTPVRERTLTDEEMKRMKFWWDRMELVQGMGKRLNTANY